MLCAHDKWTPGLRGSRAHRGGLPIVDAQVGLDGGGDAARAAQHAGRGAADENVVLADGGAVEHGIERGHLRSVHQRAIGVRAQGRRPHAAGES